MYYIGPKLVIKLIELIVKLSLVPVSKIPDSEFSVGKKHPFIILSLSVCFCVCAWMYISMLCDGACICVCVCVWMRVTSKRLPNPWKPVIFPSSITQGLRSFYPPPPRPPPGISSTNEKSRCHNLISFLLVLPSRRCKIRYPARLLHRRGDAPKGLVRSQGEPLT